MKYSMIKSLMLLLSFTVSWCSYALIPELVASGIVGGIIGGHIGSIAQIVGTHDLQKLASQAKENPSIVHTQTYQRKVAIARSFNQLSPFIAGISGSFVGGSLMVLASAIGNMRIPI